MALSQAIVDAFYLQACLADEAPHVVRVVHLAVPVCHCGEVEAGHCKAEGSGLKALAVPEGFHDEDPCLVGHGLLCPCQYADNLFLTEAIEELRHPNGIEAAFSFGKASFFVEQVDGVALDAVRTRLACYVLLHHLYLLRQVEDSHFGRS